jgi:FkbM family methyltransferase
MAQPPRKIAFVLASTDHGTLIVNRFDYRMVDANAGYGVGYSLLETSGYDAQEGAIVMQLLTLRRRHFGDGVMAVDCGANIGVRTVEWARGMAGWGRVIAFEAQERIYYALAGNITINNCFNAQAVHAAVGAANGTLGIPVVDYTLPATFGSLELRPSPSNEFIGQQIDYAPEKLTPVRMMAIDSLDLARLDLLKIDVEGMELEVLQGASATLQRLRPILLIERIKAPTSQIAATLSSQGYDLFPLGLNFLAVHATDPTRQSVAVTPPAAAGTS